MARTTWSPELRHPMYATRLLCEVANERGVSTADVLTGTGSRRTTWTRRSSSPRGTKSWRCAGAGPTMSASGRRGQPI
jgi:hypothetical protein